MDNEGETKAGPLKFEPKGGFDWFDGSAYGTWDSKQFEALAAELNRLRSEAENGQEVFYVAPEGDRLAVRPHGKKGVQARWGLEWDDCQLWIVNREHERESHCNVFIHIGSCKLMQDGFLKAWDDVTTLLQSMGFRMSKAVPSRADFCIDLPGVDCRDFVRDLWSDRAITKASKGSLHWKGVPGVQSSTGFNLGTDTMLRVYNKLEEVINQPAKAAILIQERYDGELPEVATRVEFQLRRDSLKENWSVETVDDLLVKLPSIIEWLTHKWFRLTEDFDRKNRNHDEAVTSSLWVRVQQAFASVFDGSKVEKPSRRKYVPNPEALTKQLVGVGESLLAASNEAIETAEEFAERLAEVVRANAVCGFAGFKVKCQEFAVRAMLPIGNRVGVFDEWNAWASDEPFETSKELAVRRWAETKAWLDDLREEQRGRFLFERGLSEVEASF